MHFEGRKMFLVLGHVVSLRHFGTCFKEQNLPDMLAHICNHGFQEAEIGGMQRVPGQPELQAKELVTENK